jgi:hypothetical protein
LHAEILALRHQLLVLQAFLRMLTASACGLQIAFSRLWLSRLWKGWRLSHRIIKPKTNFS